MVLGRIKGTQTYQRIAAFVHRGERFFMPGMLVGGMATDVLQFHTLSIQTTFTIMGVYTLVCAVTMIIMAIPPHEERRVLRYVQLVAPFLQQFTIGAMLSTAMLFYWFSGDVAVSWPIIGLLAVFMLSNEVLRHVVTKPHVQAVVFYFAFFSLAAVFAAYVVNSLHPLVFVLGGLASLVVMGIFLRVFIRAGGLEAKRRQLWIAVVAVFAVMNLAYFTNIIPPIPLSLRDAGMYYSVVRENGEYTLVGEEETWFEKLIPGQNLAIHEGDPVYAYTAIFAPADLSTTMVHRWEYYDPTTQAWETMSLLSFSVTGGRSEGFRGYSYKRALREGKWRVTVQTERGQVLGRMYFRLSYLAE